jgi:hypothetical protein
MSPKAQVSPTKDRCSVGREVAQDWSHATRFEPSAVPNGAIIVGRFRATPAGAELDASETSEGMVILALLKSPILNSPNAIVFDVPSLTS